MVGGINSSTMTRSIPPDQVEKYSSAATLSDMEIFVFPDLLYSLVLANILSPKIWAWRQDPWFAGIEKLTPYRRVLRLKQFIIDHYQFNLDLDTWGLTTKERELRRFAPFMDEATIARSNALFGYEGDRYYFDLDIRRHFGLDKYDSNIIPYWKTETVEAMDAFRYRDGYSIGAGECVSLSTLYAAAMFIICGIPLDNIFLLATPLHSQNFVLLGDGILTNNRRLLTKAMWFNGTELTQKAQRALRHEQVTIVAHHTGWMHVVYPNASIDPSAYDRMVGALRAFLSTPLNMSVMAAFLRQHADRQCCFQFRHSLHGRPHYIPAETVYRYEVGSALKVGTSPIARLLDEIDEDEFFPDPIESRVVLNDLEEFFRRHPVDVRDPAQVEQLLEQIPCKHFRALDSVRAIVEFAHLEPRLPDQAGPKHFLKPSPLPIRLGMSREEIRDVLESLRDSHPVADLAFYAWRDMSCTDWTPFMRAALERSPVSIEGARSLSDEEVEARLRQWPDESIYDGARAAQPDEVWNYRRGDGFEKAVCLANILHARRPDSMVEIVAEGPDVSLRVGTHSSLWRSTKNLWGDWRGEKKVRG